MKTQRKQGGNGGMNGSMHAYVKARLGLSAGLDDDACWPRAGSSRVHVGGKATSAARLVWTLVHGIAPRRPVFTTCGKRRCVNPSHLIDRKIRAASPATNWRLRYLYKTRGWRAEELARRYAVSIAAVTAALAGRAA